MKKVIFVLLGIFLIFSVSYAADPEDFIGTWYLKYITAIEDDNPFSGKKINSDLLGLSIKLEITEDKLTMTSNSSDSDAVALSWEQISETSIMFNIENEDIELTLENNSLVLNKDNAYMYFYKSTCECDCESLQAQIDKLTDELRVLKGEAEVKDTSEIPSIEDQKHIIIHDYTLDYLGFELDKSYDGKDVVYIYYTFTNYSDKTTSFTSPLYLNAFQDGIQLERYYNSSGTENDTQIRPGKSIDVRGSFYLRDLTNPLELEYDEAFSWTDDYKSIRLLKIN